MNSLSTAVTKLIPLHFDVLRVSGIDAEKFLQGQLTCDVKALSLNQSSLGACCTQQGRIIATFRIFKIEEEFYLLFAKEILSFIISHFSKYAVFSKVKLEDVSAEYQFLGVVDSDSEFLSEADEQQQQINAIYQIHQLNVLRILDENRFIIFGKNSQLEKYLALFKNQFCFAEDSLWKLLDLNKGIVTIYANTREKLTPQMINLPELGGVSFNKGCYVGQEIIARTHYLGKSKRHLYRAQISSDISPMIGDTLYYQQQEIGMLAEVSSATENRYLILAVIHESADLMQIVWNDQPVQNLEMLLRPK